MKIEYPTAEEQRAAIRKITKTGMAHRRPLLADFPEMYRSLGFRVIFHDMADVVFLSVLASACILYAVLENLKLGSPHNGRLYTAMFTMAPTLYLLLCLLGFWKEKMSDTYDVKMSCKYTVCHLTAFRMLIFSCACILVNLAVVGLCFAAGIVPDFWQAFLITASSLFLFSVLLLTSLFHGRGLAAPTMTAAAWVPANVLVDALFSNGYERFLQTMPLCLHIAVTAALACLYCAGLKRLTLQQKERVLC
jgi:hypothetical protein